MYITIKDLTFSYDQEYNVLDGLNIEIEEGKYLTILGSNGSGKSTLNRILSFLEKPTIGEITLDNITKEDIFLVFQNPENQFVKTKVIEELAFGLENKGTAKDEIEAKIEHITNLFQIQELLDKNPFTLSGGEKQKVMLAANLLLEPKVLILDEALEMIDEKSKEEILTYLNLLKHERNMTIIMVTHKMHDAALSDYIYVLNEGKISIKGDTKEVFSNKEEIYKARLDIPLAYYLSDYTECNYEVVRDLTKFKDYYDQIR